jgi:two-component sensor histidine kinase
MSSAVFVIFSFVLYYEYKTEGLSRFWLIITGVAYAFAIVYSIARSAQTAAEDMSVSASVVGLAFTNIAVFTGSVVFLFALVLYRQHLIRKRYSDELERRVAERTAELQDALRQRNTMLQEIHHRVGNSLQLLASFVSLQQEDVKDRDRQILKETELRVHAIADVHATLYSQHQLSHLPLQGYASDLISDMQIAYRSDADIVANIDTELEGHIDFAISFGIILNELITNAAKHGGVVPEKAHVEVSLADGADSLLLTVRDYGPGFPPAFSPGIGTEVIDQLVHQNQGAISRASRNGVSVRVSFPQSSVVRHEPVRGSREQTA